MATIMAAAVANETVYNVMSQKIYRSNTNVHGRVTFSSTFFVDVLENGGSYFKLPDGARVVAAKTGTTDEAGKCLVSCIESGTGERYVIVTANALTTNVYCSDYTSIYEEFVYLPSLDE
jgi:D-alanyl-D-alanine carboxypeptidase